MAHGVDVAGLNDTDLAQLVSDCTDEKLERDANATKDDVQAHIDARSGLVTLGATAIADSSEGNWVVVEFPTDSSLTGIDKAFVVGFLAECVRGYGAQWVVQGKSIRNRAAQMKSNLGAMQDAITAASA